MSPRLAACVLLGLLAWPQDTLAHSRGTSYSQWTFDGRQASVEARVSQLELTRLQLHPEQTPDYAQRVGQVLASHLQLWSGEARCAADRATTTVLADGWVSARWQLHCDAAAPLTVRSTLFHDVAPGHQHFVRVEVAGRAPSERVLTFAEPGFSVDGPAAAPSTGGFVRLGIEHILDGWDHLCFVLALILLAARLRDVALIVTGFTIAHSLTLAAAVLGWVSAPMAAIEALIGYSIVVVAAENLWLRAGRETWVPILLVATLLALAVSGWTGLPPAALLGLALFTACYFSLARTTGRPLQLRTAVAFLFGLVHGLGFAGVLTPLELPTERLAAGLLGFNLGVELGQLLVIVLVWPLLRGLERAPSARLWAGDSASACICALGTFWFVTRAFT